MNRHEWTFPQIRELHRRWMESQTLTLKALADEVGLKGPAALSMLFRRHGLKGKGAKAQTGKKAVRQRNLDRLARQCFTWRREEKTTAWMAEQLGINVRQVKDIMKRLKKLNVPYRRKELFQPKPMVLRKVQVDSLCRIADCKRAPFTRGLCRPHNTRAKKEGVLEALALPPKPQAERRRAVQPAPEPT